MEIIEYEPVNLYDGRFCKVFHSDLVALARPKDAVDSPHFHWHNSFEFNCSITGTLKCDIGSEVCYVHDYNFLFLNPNVVHRSREITVPFLGFAVLVPAAGIQQFFRQGGKEEPIIISPEQVNTHRKEIMELLMKVNRFARSEEPASLLGMNACVLQIFHLLLSGQQQEQKHAGISVSDDGRPYFEYIATHYRERITLESVAKEFGFSPSYFSRLFIKKTDRNFNVFLMTVRLNHATHLLETTDIPIPDISEESGFPSTRAFIEQFRKINRITPKQYREKCSESQRK